MFPARKYVFILVFLGLLPVSCFTPEYPYYQIRHITLSSFADAALTRAVTEVDSAGTDSVFISVDFTVDFLAHASRSGFGNPGYATTKPSNGEYGLKDDEVKEVKLTSDKVYRDAQPGSSLNHYFHFVPYHLQLQDLESLVADLNKRAPALYPATSGSKKLLAVNVPLTPGEHLLTLTFMLESGKQIAASLAIKWK